jgi:hypothetical protein
VWSASRPGRLHPREKPGTHCTGGWMGSGAGLDRCGKSRPTGIRSPDLPARSESLYRLSYPGSWWNGYWEYFPRAKWPGCKVDRSLLFITEGMNEYSRTLNPHTRLLDVKRNWLVCIFICVGVYGSVLYKLRGHSRIRKLIYCSPVIRELSDTRCLIVCEISQSQI